MRITSMNILKICLICNKEYSDLKGHFGRAHGLTNKEYKLKFPQYAEFIESEKKRKMSEAVQRRIADGSHPFLRQENKDRVRKMALKWHDNKTDEYYIEQRRRAEKARKAKGDNYKHSPETIEKMKGPRPILQGRKASDKTRAKLSEIAKNRIREKHKPETIEKMKAKWVERKESPKYKNYIKILRENAIKYKLGEKYIENIISGKTNKKFYDTSLEIKFSEFLEKNNIPYQKQYVLENNTGKWLFDFYLTNLNMLVETDGEYWHRKSKMVLNRDKKKEREALKEGYVFLRISDLYWREELIFKSTEEIIENNKFIISERNKLFS